MLTFVEYFAGIGLMRVGLERAGWQCLWSNDISPKKFAMYQAYFADTHETYCVEDVFNVDPDSIPLAVLATASFPCVDLSLAGKLSGIHGADSGAFWGFTRILASQRRKPQVLLLENVLGWLTSNRGADFRVTIDTLNQLGYACDVMVVNAAHFVPQSRPRVFVVAVRTERPNHDLLKVLRREHQLAPARLQAAVSENSDLMWHTFDVPLLPQTTMTLADIIEVLPVDDARWWSADDVARHMAMMSQTDIAYLEQRRASQGVTYNTLYRRVRNKQQRAEVRKDALAGCLRTARGGSSRQIVVKTQQDGVAMRWMTAREYARLQGVPDDFPLPANTNQALTGFGDAVCVPVVTWLAKHILNQAMVDIQDGQLGSVATAAPVS